MAKAQKPSAAKHLAYQLHVELSGAQPVIWRRVWVEGQMTLVQLHHVIQAAMGWTDAHLHQFIIQDKMYATPHDEDDLGRPPIDERRVTLKQVLELGMRFEYLYDFGDDWRHTVHVEEVKTLPKPEGYAYVKAGAGACPPEDCGGVYAYQEILNALKTDDTNEEVVSFLKWAGPDFDPGHFDRRAANAALLRMAWNKWGEK